MGTVRLRDEKTSRQDLELALRRLVPQVSLHAKAEFDTARMDMHRRAGRVRLDAGTSEEGHAIDAVQARIDVAPSFHVAIDDRFFADGHFKFP